MDNKEANAGLPVAEAGWLTEEVLMLHEGLGSLELLHFGYRPKDCFDLLLKRYSESVLTPAQAWYVHAVVCIWMKSWHNRFGCDPDIPDVRHSELLIRLLTGGPYFENNPSDETVIAHRKQVGY